jgi:hypothetical protein
VSHVARKMSSLAAIAQPTAARPALEERPRPRKVALVIEQGGKIVEARRGSAMLGAERLFVYC